MAGVSELIGRARAAGLVLRAEGGTLRVRGPRRHETLVLELLARKQEVLQDLAGEREAMPEPPTRLREGRLHRWLRRWIYDHGTPVDSLRHQAEADRLAWPRVVAAAQEIGVDAVVVGVERGGVACWRLPNEGVAA